MILSQKRHEKGLWWDRNWPVLEGCTPVSPACDNCFAAEYAHRFESSLPYLRGLTTPGGKWNGTVIMRQDQLELPLKTKKPTVWFMAERSDLFHPSVPDDYLDRIFAVMALCPQHTFMVLTKRPVRMRDYFSDDTLEDRLTDVWRGDDQDKETWSLLLPLQNIWIGVTAENQEQAEKRIPFLLQTPAAQRFVSIEPMLGHVNLAYLKLDGSNGFSECDALDTDGAGFYPSSKFLGPIDWVICGGESGRNARPIHPSWVRILRDQCTSAMVPFFFKQWGEYRPATSVAEATNYPIVSQNRQQIQDKRGREMPAFSACYRLNHQVASILDGSGEFAHFDCAMVRSGKKAAGRLIDGKEYLELPA